MAQEDGFDEVDDGGLLIGVEVVEGFEVQAEDEVVGAAFVVVEDEGVGGEPMTGGVLRGHVFRCRAPLFLPSLLPQH